MANKVYDIVTDAILAKLEDGVIPWQKPWDAKHGLPRNMSTGKHYRGINVFLLSLAGRSTEYWLTYKQCQSLGGQVNKGESGTLITFYRSWQPKDSEDTIPVLRYYKVFNIDQTTLDAPAPESVPLDPLPLCEDVVRAMPSAPAIEHAGQRACYHTRHDMVSMPEFESFVRAEAYYSTLFHELAHSTGHESRLNRPGIAERTYFGSDLYSKEELIAEMAASMVCAVIGIENAVIDASASYISNWLEALRNDKTMVVQAASKAQKAADWILNKRGG